MATSAQVLFLADFLTDLGVLPLAGVLNEILGVFLIGSFSVTRAEILKNIFLKQSFFMTYDLVIHLRVLDVSTFIFLASFALPMELAFLFWPFEGCGVVLGVAAFLELLGGVAFLALLGVAFLALLGVAAFVGDFLALLGVTDFAGDFLALFGVATLAGDFLALFGVVIFLTLLGYC